MTESVFVTYILYHTLLVFFLFVRGYGGDVPFTKCQPGVMFSCRMGLNCYSMSLHQLYIASNPKHRNEMYKNNDYEQTYWYLKFHICIEARGKHMFHIVFNC